MLTARYRLRIAGQRSVELKYELNFLSGFRGSEVHDSDSGVNLLKTFDFEINMQFIKPL